MKGFNFFVNSKTSRIVQEYSKANTLSPDDVLRDFLQSSTYEVLSDPETGLYLEMFEYVYDMYLEELSEEITPRKRLGERKIIQ